MAVIHEGHEPDALVDLFDADILSSEDGADVDLLSTEADPAAAGEFDVLKSMAADLGIDPHFAY